MTQPVRVLISGGLGYLGGRIAVHLARVGHQIFLGSRRFASPPEWLPDATMVQMKWDEQGHLTHICQGIDVVIHAAGMNAAECLADPVAALDFNGTKTAKFKAAAAKALVKRFIYLSTAHIYASPLVGTITEETCPRNLHPYATSNLAGEIATQQVGVNEEIESFVLRISNAVGAPVSRNVNCWDLLANDLCNQSITTGRLILRSPRYQQANFIAISEVCRVVENFITLDARKTSRRTFNVGSRSSKTLLEIAKIIQERCACILEFRPQILTLSQAKKSTELVFKNCLLEEVIGEINSNLNNEIDSLIFCANKCINLK